MEKKRDLLFLGGFGAPVQVFLPWFVVLGSRGFDVHQVPNSFLGLDPVSTFARSFVDFSQRFESFDVVAISYGGPAALYAAYLSPDLCDRVRKMVLVCCPILGVPLLDCSPRALMPRSIADRVAELTESSEIVQSIKDPDFHGRIRFDLHCIYHDRDMIAPPSRAVLDGVGTSHRLSFEWSFVPSALMHDAAYANPETLRTVLSILG